MKPTPYRTVGTAALLAVLLLAAFGWASVHSTEIVARMFGDLCYAYGGFTLFVAGKAGWEHHVKAKVPPAPEPAK